MEISRRIEQLRELHSTGALTDQEYQRAKQVLFASKSLFPDATPEHDPGPAIDTATDQATAAMAVPNDTRPPGGETGRSVRQRSKHPIVLVAAAVSLVMVGAVVGWFAFGHETSDPLGPDAALSDAECKDALEDMGRQGSPNAVAYPAMRGLGCGEWLDSQLEDAQNSAPPG